MNLLEVLTAVNGQVKGAADYDWNCFGPDAKYLDVGNDKLGHVASMIFDSDDGTVYAIEMFLADERKAWRWIDERFYDFYLEECQVHGVNPRVDFDNVPFQNISPIEILMLLSELTADPNIQFDEADNDIT